MEPTVLVASGRDPSGNGNEDLTCKSRLTICWTTFRSIMWSNHASHLRAERTPSACRGYADDERLHRRLLSEALARFLAVVQGPPGSCRCAGPGSGESETDVIVVDSAPPQRLFLDIECSMNVSCRPYALATSPVTKTPFIVSRAGRYIVASADTNLEQSRAEMAQHEDMLFAACDALCMPKDHLSPATPIPEAKQDLMDKSSLEWVEVHRQKLVPGTCVVVVVEWESAGHGSSPVLGAEGDPGSRQRRCREAMGGPSMRYTMEAMQYYLLAMQTRIQFELLATGASFAYVVVAEPGGDWNGCLVAVDTEVQKMVYTHCLHWTSTFGGWAWDAGTLGSGRVPTLSRDVVASLLDKLGIGSSGRVEDTLLAPLTTSRWLHRCVLHRSGTYRGPVCDIHSPPFPSTPETLMDPVKTPVDRCSPPHENNRKRPMDVSWHKAWFHPLLPPPPGPPPTMLACQLHGGKSSGSWVDRWVSSGM
jgi:hypothetical protein